MVLKRAISFISEQLISELGISNPKHNLFELTVLDGVSNISPKRYYKRDENGNLQEIEEDIFFEHTGNYKSNFCSGGSVVVGKSEYDQFVEWFLSHYIHKNYLNGELKINTESIFFKRWLIASHNSGYCREYHGGPINGETYSVYQIRKIWYMRYIES